jgi:hypothetical protein
MPIPVKVVTKISKKKSIMIISDSVPNFQVVQSEIQAAVDFEP